MRTGLVDALIGPRFSVPADEFNIVHLYSDGRLAVLSATNRLACADQVPLPDLLELTPLNVAGLPQAVLDHFLLTELRGGEGPRQDLSQPFLMADGLAFIAAGSAFLTVTTATSASTGIRGGLPAPVGRPAHRHRHRHAPLDEWRFRAAAEPDSPGARYRAVTDRASARRHGPVPAG